MNKEKMSDKEIAECVILMLAMFVIVMLSFASDKIISPINTHSVIKSEKNKKRKHTNARYTTTLV